ncbi:MAG: phospholipid carrier-dependent glycosyltransferase [Anaerolineae bacterium]|nr:phospholipid carrier-dependent glycosyltransferase [Anaerolineae bacterium]
MRKEKIGIWGILFVSLILRCVNIDARSIQYDDAFSIFLAERSLPDIIRGTAADTMPPLFYFLLHFWMRLGEQVWFLRMLSILFSLGSLVVLYFLVRTLFDQRAAFWAAVLAAISPLQIYHSQDIRMYAALAFFQLAHWGFFVQIYRHGKTKQSTINWITFVFFGVLAMYTHNLAIFGLCVPLVYLIFKRQWKDAGKVLLADLVIGLLAAPWLVMVPGQIAKIQGAFWTPRPGLVELVQAGILFVGTLPLPGIWLIIITVLSLQAIVFVLIETWKNRSNEGVRLLTAMTIIPPALLFVASYLMRPVFVPRGFLVSSLAFLGLAGAAVGKKRAGGFVLLFLFGLAAVISLPYQIFYQEFPRSPFREAANYLAEQTSLGDTIVHDNKLSYFPMLFYRRDLPQEFLADVPGSHNDTLAYETQKSLGIFPRRNLQEAVRGKDGVFFVVFARTIAEYEALGEGTHPNLNWLKEQYKLANIENFGDLQIYHFTR